MAASTPNRPRNPGRSERGGGPGTRGRPGPRAKPRHRRRTVALEPREARPTSLPLLGRERLAVAPEERRLRQRREEASLLAEADRQGLLRLQVAGAVPVGDDSGADV